MKKIILALFFAAFAVAAYSQTVIKHVSNSSNISGHITTINNSATNNNPNAVLIVTQDYGVYNVHEIGVWYAGGKWKIFNQNRKPMPKNNRFNILVLPKGSRSYVHTTTGGNTTGHITRLNHPSVNGKSNALVFVTQNYGKYNTSVVGVWYNSDRWKVYNEDMKPMPVGTRFNVYVVYEGAVNNGRIRGTAFKHTNQSSGHISWMNHSRAKDRSSQLFIAQNWKGTYNPHTTGVWYSNGKWTTYNQDRKTMAKNVRFNVLAVKSSSAQSNQKPVKVTKSPSNSKAKVKVSACCYGSDWSGVSFIAENSREGVIKPSTKNSSDDAVFYLSDGTYTIRATAKPIICADQSDPYASTRVVVRNGVASPSNINLKLKF